MVAGFADRTILVVRWAGTRRSVVSHALNEIVAAGALSAAVPRRIVIRTVAAVPTVAGTCRGDRACA